MFLESFPKERLQFVKACGIKSAPRVISQVAPQGRVLSPNVSTTLWLFLPGLFLPAPIVSSGYSYMRMTLLCGALVPLGKPALFKRDCKEHCGIFIFAWKIFAYRHPNHLYFLTEKTSDVCGCINTLDLFLTTVFLGTLLFKRR